MQTFSINSHSVSCSLVFSLVTLREIREHSNKRKERMGSFSYRKTYGPKTDHWQWVQHLFETINSIFILCIIVHWAPRKYIRIQANFYGIKTLWGLFLPFEYKGREISHLTFVMFQDQRGVCWKLSSVKAMSSMSSVWFSPSSDNGRLTTKLKTGVT